MDSKWIGYVSYVVLLYLNKSVTWPDLDDSNDLFFHPDLGLTWATTFATEF